MRKIFTVLCLLNIFLFQIWIRDLFSVQLYSNYISLFIFSQFFLLHGCYDNAINDLELIKIQQESRIKNLESDLSKAVTTKNKALYKKRQAQFLIQRMEDYRNEKYMYPPDEKSET